MFRFFANIFSFIFLGNFKPKKVLHTKTLKYIPTQEEYQQIDILINSWVKTHINYSFNIEDIAIGTCLDENIVKHYFSYYLSLSFREWKVQKRVELAKDLLITKEDLSIQKIGELVGYNNKSNFYRQFIKYVKCSPSKWRDCRGNLYLLNK